MLVRWYVGSRRGKDTARSEGHPKSFWVEENKRLNAKSSGRSPSILTL